MAQRRYRILDGIPWVQFLGGCWRASQPSRAGLYPVASREGAIMGLRLFVERDGRVQDAQVGPNEPGWQGWIWSDPLPAQLAPRSPSAWGTEDAPKITPPDEKEAKALLFLAVSLTPAIVDELGSPLDWRQRHVPHLLRGVRRALHVAKHKGPMANAPEDTEDEDTEGSFLGDDEPEPPSTEALFAEIDDLGGFAVKA